MATFSSTKRVEGRDSTVAYREARAESTRERERAGMKHHMGRVRVLVGQVAELVHRERGARLRKPHQLHAGGEIGIFLDRVEAARLGQRDGDSSTDRSRR